MIEELKFRKRKIDDTSSINCPPDSFTIVEKINELVKNVNTLTALSSCDKEFDENFSRENVLGLDSKDQELIERASKMPSVLKGNTKNWHIGDVYYYFYWSRRNIYEIGDSLIADELELKNVSKGFCFRSRDVAEAVLEKLMGLK